MKHNKNLIKSAKNKGYRYTYDYSLWNGGDIRFCGQKQTLICNHNYSGYLQTGVLLRFFVNRYITRLFVNRNITRVICKEVYYSGYL
jgi:hypothetical protein